METNKRAGYEIVLEDLENERTAVHREVAELQRRLKELDFNIASLSRRLNANPIAAATPRQQSIFPPEQKYAFISVRWAILDLLNDSEPMTTADIAEVLKACGVKTKAANFTNNVSAVLSTSMREKDQEEVEVVDGKWKLTERGRNAIFHIRMTPKFLQSCPWAGAPDAVTSGATN
jgi:hypothetical protein